MADRICKPKNKEEREKAIGNGQSSSKRRKILLSEEQRRRIKENRAEREESQKPEQQEQEKQPEPASFCKKKKPKFEEQHNRVTTYISKENHRKIKELKESYDMPQSTTINKALEEYFRNHNL